MEWPNKKLSGFGARPYTGYTTKPEFVIRQKTKYPAIYPAGYRISGQISCRLNKAGFSVHPCLKLTRIRPLGPPEITYIPGVHLESANNMTTLIFWTPLKVQ